MKAVPGSGIDIRTLSPAVEDDDLRERRKHCLKRRKDRAKKSLLHHLELGMPYYLLHFHPIKHNLLHITHSFHDPEVGSGLQFKYSMP